MKSNNRRCWHLRWRTVLFITAALLHEPNATLALVTGPSVLQKRYYHGVTRSTSSRTSGIKWLQKPNAISVAKRGGRSRWRAATQSDLETKLNEEQVPDTMHAAVKRFFFGPDRGPILISGIIAGMIGIRLCQAPLSIADALVFGCTVMFWWFQEHVVHGALLHSQFDWIGKEIHQKHHDKHYHHISLDPPLLMIVWLLVVHLLIRMIFGYFSVPSQLALSASIGYAVAGLFYEWAHYIVHTKVRPRSVFMKQIKNNHIRHHLVNHNYWLGFSVPAIDNWLGTNPPIEKARQEQGKRRAQLL